MSAGANIFSRADPRARSLGYVNWCGDPAFYGAATTLANQEVQVKSIWVPFGVPITKVVLKVTTAGSGTVPTGFFVGIGNRTKMLAQSANLNNDAGLTATGIKAFTIGSYTPKPSDSADGFFYAVILQNGAFATTNVQFARSGGINAHPSGTVDAGRAGTGQTALPANGSTYSTAVAAAGGQDWWIALMP